MTVRGLSPLDPKPSDPVPIMTSVQTNPMIDSLEMLTAREQLMEDIDSIVSGFFDATYDDYEEEDCNQLIRVLCDAVCKNFPAK